MTSTGTPAQGVRLRMEQHDPEQQIEHALTRAAGWLYDRLGVTEVTRKKFSRTFIAVLKAEESHRFSASPDTSQLGAIVFDGDRARAHPYLDTTFEKLDLKRVFLPPTCVMWIYTHPHVAVYTYTHDNGIHHSTCLYPSLTPHSSEIVPPPRVRERDGSGPKPKEFSRLRLFFLWLRDR